eukprot:661445-Rhodomonas_salina.2
MVSAPCDGILDSFWIQLAGIPQIRRPETRMDAEKEEERRGETRRGLQRGGFLVASREKCGFNGGRNGRGTNSTENFDQSRENRSVTQRRTKLMAWSGEEHARSRLLRLAVVHQ